MSGVLEADPLGRGVLGEVSGLSGVLNPSDFMNNESLNPSKLVEVNLEISTSSRGSHMGPRDRHVIAT